MYWLIGSLIMIVMMGVLAVADNVAVPINLSVIDIVSVSGLSLALIVFATILFAIAQLNIPSINRHSTDKTHVDSSLYKTQFPLRIIKHLVFAIFAIILVIGSTLQALVAHQQAETTKVTDATRVQALVRIEGLSDSVYDAATGSGYRQVAVVTHISPLVAELTPQDLAITTANYLEIDKNSLSENYNNRSDTDNISDIKHEHEHRILLNAYPKKSANDNQLSSLNHLQPGDELFMSLALAPLATSKQALNNPSGFDSYRWLRGRHIDGVANILAVSPSVISSNEIGNEIYSRQTLTSDAYLQRFRTRIDQGRWQLRQHFYRDWSAQTTAEQQAKAVTLSLLTGDRSLINRDTKNLYQLAGISHLLAISGTHVLFLAIVLAGTVVLLFDRNYPAIYRRIPRWQVRWWVMIGAAFIYALFTGFDVPAARTAWMLLAIGLVRLTLLPISTMRVLLALAVLMAWRDPYVLWQAGYWLSFIAVALLLKYDDTSYQHQATASTSAYDGKPHIRISNTLSSRAWQMGKRVFKLQFWLFLTLLPVTLLLFGKASLWGIFINLFAIGLFGWVIVPLNLLAGLCYLLVPSIADTIWMVISTIVGNLHDLMAWLTSLPALSEAWLYTPVNIAILSMALLGILPWLLPRGLLSRWLALPPLTLLMMAVYANQQSFVTVPTLYILPTSDSYITAALLQYPTVKNESTSWLYLADHRAISARTKPSNLTADKLSAILEQQLGSLSIDKLEGIIVQSSSAGLTDTLVSDRQRVAAHFKGSELLPMTVAQLNERLPISQYWQAGRSDRWSASQRADKIIRQSKDTPTISAQRCEQGKMWQLANDGLSIQAMTGWTEIGDISVWDCTIAIDSRLPIRILRYNAADPLASLPASLQTQRVNNPLAASQTASTQSRLILDTDTHQRVWQMWSLLCPAEAPNESMIFKNTTWLGHSTSRMTSDMISRQKVHEIMTYDDKPLEIALSLK
ncbi:MULTISPECIES: ComEC/Rec2 family competence protein [unclassified Psychrobacter]|uniref:ComEC/Rec2 family competence protein n=1 Tax=unclassified Psychrobacter TaxID=196806 RepID=UPI0025B56343|nr:MULTISPECIES: ComEC/Rec2 family competence protein [unclassified Psychrobacter]MDN3452757.1 ComEC/Rec2 family competence protein [Psychrobacter sp. APC 3350]MDN3502664.1 ComEC/Rec2 family competence protein [Psychrobacter sp. 5A.1]